jgi:tetratricopeptide (TPR) repeat protein
MLGAVYDKMGNDELALVYYRRAIDLNPDARAYSNLGTLYYRQGKFAEAAQAYSEAARLEPGPAKHRNLGDVYARLGQATRAREQYERAVALSQSILGVNPKDAHTLGLLAVSEAKLGRHDVAARHAEEAVGLAPLDGEVLYRKAVVAALAGRTGPALAALRQALDHGYSAADAARDDDFGPLRDSPAFRQLVGRSPASADKGGM